MSQTCPRCGFAIPLDTGAGCARCLLRAAFSSTLRALPRRFGKYELRSQLGRGGAGVVFLAHDPDADRLVAIKLLREGDLASPDEVARFQEEARRAAGLRHEGIVRVLDVGEHRGEPYFTMELIDGGTLAQRAAELRGRPSAIARLVADVARAVHHAHQHFVLHRDLKPANLLLDKAGAPHVADFGIARALDAHRLTAPGVLAGTLPYMAPEQITTPEDLTVAVDVYGLGAILYELLCGRPPFDADSAPELSRAVVEQAPVAPRQRAPDAGIDEDLEAICLKCLNKNPADRYASAAGVAADLDRYQNDEPVVARRAPRGERTARLLRRYPTTSALALTGVLLLATTAAVAVSVAGTQEHELRAEAVKVDRYAALALSGAVLYELRGLGDELEAAARAAPIVELAKHRDDQARVAAFRAHPRANGFDSYLLVGADARWIARAPRPEQDRVGAPLGWRDYFAGAAQLGRAGTHGVHVSRAYVSTADGTARFSLTTPVYCDGTWCGVLQGAIDAAAALGALTLSDPGEPARIASLLVRRDRDRPDQPMPDDWLVMLHDGLVHGELDVVPDVGGLRRLSEAAGAARGAVSEETDYRDPIPGFSGRWVAGLAAVRGAPAAVVIQTRLESAIAPNQRLASRWRTATTIVFCAGLLVFFLLRVGLVRARDTRL